MVVSLSHALHHFGLDSTVSVVLAVEVLRFVSHAVASVAHDGDLHFRVVRHLVVLAVLIGSHRDLEASRERLVFFGGAHIAVLKSRSHWVHIEEGILPVLDVRHGFPVHGHVALVSHRWQI